MNKSENMYIIKIIEKSDKLVVIKKKEVSKFLIKWFLIKWIFFNIFFLIKFCSGIWLKPNYNKATSLINYNIANNIKIIPFYTPPQPKGVGGESVTLISVPEGYF